MKLLLTMNIPYYPGYGGANKGNRYLLENLAARGHSVRAVVPALETPGRLTREQLLEELRSRCVEVSSDLWSDSFTLNGVEVQAVTDASRLRAHLVNQIREFDPDRVLVSSEDPSQNLLDAAVNACPERVVYLTRTTSFLPFGPQAFFPSQGRTNILRRVPLIIALGQFVADYIHQWSGLESTIVELDFYGSGPFPYFGRFDQGFITMVNPCAVKGLSIFLALARRMPEAQFAAVPTWGTTEADVAALKQLPNVRLLNPTEEIDEIFAQTRVLLMPSLWAEARGRMVVEAMLRGIPVLASNVGGLPEVKLGTDYLLPVRPIERFEGHLDGNWIPVSSAPEQDIEPWYTSLNDLLSDRELYDRQSKISRQVSLRFVSSLSVAPLEELLARGTAETALNGRSASQFSGRYQDKPLQDGANRSSLLEGLGQLTREQQALLSLRLKKRALAREDQMPRTPPILPISRDGYLPLSYAQQRLWFLAQLTPGSASYNVHSLVRLEGQLNIPALELAFDEVARRHEALRTTFDTVHEQPVQVVALEARLPVSIFDLRHLDEARRQSEKERLVTADMNLPFDLKHGPLFRVKLIRLREQEAILSVTAHHIAIDGQSMGVFARELSAAYEAFSQGRQPLLPEISIQYADFAFWQRQWLRGEVLQTHLDYWKRQLAGAPPVLDLPTDRPRPSLRSSSGARHHFALSKRLSDSLRTLSHREGATMFTTLLAAFKILLYRYTGQEDIVIGSSFSGRSHVELESLIGLFVNTLALRTKISSGISFRQLLSQVRGMMADAITYQHLPFEKLVEELQPARNMSYSPIFQVMFNFEEASPPDSQMPGLTVTALDVETGLANFDIALFMERGEGGLSGFLCYSTDIFDEVTIRRMIRHFEMLLSGIVTNSDERISSLPLLPETERHQLLTEWNETRVAFPQTQALHHLIEAQVERTPESVAVRFDDQSLTYAEMNRRSNQLAHYLRRHGVGPEAPVALFLERSLEMVIAILGTLKAGGAYLPLDTESPAQRLAFMLEDGGAHLLLTQGRLQERLPQSEARVVNLDDEWPNMAGLQESNPQSGVGRDNAAYLIYTSGSTGQPKCAINSHAGICNRLQWMQEAYHLGREDRVLQKTPYSFDVSVWEFFWPLMEGARLVMARPGGHRESAYLIKLIKEEQVSIVHFVPSMLQMFIEEAEVGECLSLRNVICSGEALSVDLKDRCRKRLGAGLHNLYGPTEAAVDVTSWACEQESCSGAVPIGRPISNLHLYVLDGEMEPAPIGIAGELYIGGIGVGRGYLKRAALTAEKFVPDPFGEALGARLYKSGDLVRYLPDGSIDFLGRLDHQVKLRGQRIELGEIENVLNQCPGVKDGVVVAREGREGDRYLTAYVVAREQDSLSISKLRDFLRERLPDYMVPAAYVMMERLPRTSSGKLDRRALPEGDKTVDNSDAVLLWPRDELELQLILMWEELLGVTRIGVKDDFFVLGGHSLLAVRLINKIKKLHGITLSLGDLFGAPTIEGIAGMLRRQTPSATVSVLVGIQPKGSKQPFFCVHPLSGFAACYYELASYMKKDQPFYGLQAPSLDGRQKPFSTIEEMAAYYVKEIREFQRDGPYLLGGWSMGGTVAFEMAQQLKRQNQEVALLALLDNGKMSSRKPSNISDTDWLIEICADMNVFLPSDHLRKLSIDEQLDYATHQVEAAGLIPEGGRRDIFRQYFYSTKAHSRATESYCPQPYPGWIDIFRTEWRGERDDDPDLDWKTLAPGGFQIHKISGTHQSIMRAPHVQELADRLIDCLDQAHSRIDTCFMNMN